jgi:hypothetical protein
MRPDVQNLPQSLLSLALAAFVSGAVFSSIACTAPSSGDPPRLTRADALAPVAFVNVTVVPMEQEETLAGQTVVIRNGRIAQIGPADRIDVPRDARRIPGAGKYLMPGLVDAHFHLHSMMTIAGCCTSSWPTA